MGLSSKHARTIPLVLNLATGYINSQFNIIFDDWFVTVAACLTSLPDFNSSQWSQMFGDSTFQFNDDDAVEFIAATNSDLPETLDGSHHAVTGTMNRHHPPINQILSQCNTVETTDRLTSLHLMMAAWK